MPKKRSMPHGRSTPKTKKEHVRIFTPMPTMPADSQATSGTAQRVSITSAPTPAPGLGAPRSAIRSYTPRGRGSASGVGLTTDYRYVISDLKRIGVIAGAIFVVLVILAFVIH